MTDEGGGIDTEGDILEGFWEEVSRELMSWQDVLAQAKAER